MAENEDLSDEVFWMKKMKEHWKTLIVVIIAGICALVGAILVLIWFIETSTLGGKGTWTLNRWTLDYVVGFWILIILWELLFVGVPSGLFFGIGGYIWWRRLPEDEKLQFKEREKKAKAYRKEKYGGGGGFSFFMFIAYCIYIALDGHYKTQFGDKPYSYWLYSYLLTFMWIVIIIGIPIAIILLIVYFTVWRKKSE